MQTSLFQKGQVKAPEGCLQWGQPSHLGAGDQDHLEAAHWVKVPRKPDSLCNACQTDLSRGLLVGEAILEFLQRLDQASPLLSPSAWRGGSSSASLPSSGGNLAERNTENSQLLWSFSETGAKCLEENWVAADDMKEPLAKALSYLSSAEC